MTLAQGTIDKTYIVQNIDSDEGMRDFLFTLGCYAGEKVTIITKLSSNYIINVKDARYSIDEELAKAILVWYYKRMEVFFCSSS